MFVLFISCGKELSVQHLVQEETIYYSPLYENSVYIGRHPVDMENI